MTIANEDLLLEMQRVGTLMRRAHHKKMHEHFMARAEEREEGEAERLQDDYAHHGSPHGHGHHGEPHGHGPCHGGPHGFHHGGPHGHGMGKCGHKGEGRHGQQRILALLQVQDGMSQKDLAFLLGIRPQSLTVALDKLEGEGFIERKQDEDDKRTRRVFITEAGSAKATEAAQERAARADGVFSVLSDEEKDQLASILSKLASNLEETKE